MAISRRKQGVITIGNINSIEDESIASNERKVRLTTEKWTIIDGDRFMEMMQKRTHILGLFYTIGIEYRVSSIGGFF